MLKPRDKVLLIGGGGYVGREIARQMNELRKEVVVFGRSGMGLKKVREVMGDVAKKEDMEVAFGGCAVVVYLVTENKSRKLDDHLKANIEGLKNALMLAEKYRVFSFIYVSTTMVFEKVNKTVDETNYVYRREKTGDFYVDTKVEAVNIVRNNRNLNWKIIYPTLVVNRDFKYKKPAGMMDKIKEKLGLLTQGGVMATGGDKRRRMSFVYIDQLAKAVIFLILNGSKEKEYILVAINTTPEEYIKTISPLACFFPFRIPEFIFKRLIGIKRFNLLHQENCYSTASLQKLLINRSNSFDV